MKVHPDEEAISAWLDGEAAPGEADFLRHHLAGCIQCQEQLESLAEVRVALSTFRNVTAPATLKVRLLHDWESRWGRLNSGRPVGSFVLPWMPAVALGMMFLLLIPHFRSRKAADIHPPVTNGSGDQVAKLPPLVPPPITINENLGGEESPTRIEEAASIVPISGIEGKIAQVQKRVGLMQWASMTRPQKLVTRTPRPSHRSRSRTRRLDRRTIPAAPVHPSVQLATANPSPPEIPSEGPAAMQVASATPVMELTVEETPGDSGPARPRQTSCVWMAKDTETGEVSGGSVVRNYNASGNLESVSLHLPVTEKIAAAPAGSDPAPQTPEAGETPPEDGKDRINQIDPEENHESTDHHPAGSHSLYAGIVRTIPHPAPSI